MTADTRAAFEALRERVEKETGERLLILSAYRTVDEQREELDAGGEAIAARPGESEHEIGLALDICIRGLGRETGQPNLCRRGLCYPLPDRKGGCDGV